MSEHIFADGSYVLLRDRDGVWQVTGRSGQRSELKACHSQQRASVSNSEIARAMAPDAVLQEAVERIGSVRTIQAPSNKVRREFYQQAMDAFDELEWVRVIKTAYLRGKDHCAQPYEEAYSQRAKSYLHGQLAIALHIPLEQVEQYITQKVESDEW
ncbi:hypothetical protein H8K20_05155 [Neobittarella massiliensis]|uniref:Uncharacterized protein n=1 Tax=Neobittarella massiliensis (ex Bilen et al. 2018) TaxID=2041842 RepID=A0A8J6LUJ3_9FIRM|nr:hypothetical protein [Neobittarella massiliensis]MBC3515790.1 hypothetical protein [Neobittarella massiliensis]